MSFLDTLCWGLLVYILLRSAFLIYNLKKVAETAVYEEWKPIYKPEVEELFAMYVDENGELHEVLANPW